MLLPWIVLILSMVYGFGFPDSISATYYIVTCIAPFMIILGAAGLLLITYKGYDKQDAIVCTLAGICALLVCLFPCSNTAEDLVGTFYIDKDISGWIHNITAGIFFALLAYNSFFLFTKTSGEMTAEKRKRNLIYKICGIGMIVSFLGLIPTYIFNLHGGT